MATGKFLKAEWSRQAAFKQAASGFSEAARQDGVYHKLPRVFCLPVDCAAENLHHSIRNEAIGYFRQYGILWHNGIAGKPSNHLCSSQVCAVNFLFPFADEPEALKALLLPVFPSIQRMLPIDGQYVAFEYIGSQDYLGESRNNRRRTRGANTTSADAAVMFEREDGERQLVLVEWKYTESYPPASIQMSDSGTDRSILYSPLVTSDDAPIDRTQLSNYGDLFFEPFYQFMRQQLLAHEMEKAKELGTDVVSVLHIAPASNYDFRRVTSPNLRPLGVSAIEVWKRLVRVLDRFQSISTEALFGQFPVQDYPALSDWWAYIHERYGWLQPEG